MTGTHPRIPPPAIALAAAVFMWVVARATPRLAIGFPERRPFAMIVALVGIAIVVAGVMEFRRARTTLTPLNPAAASALVTSGIYRYTRNPMYLGMGIVLLAWSAYLLHPLALFGVAGFAVYITRFQIIPEENALRSLFPGAFDEYARRARRWI